MRSVNFAVVRIILKLAHLDSKFEIIHKNVK